MAHKPETPVLVDEKLALSLFLDSLLSEPETLTAPEPALEVVTRPPLADGAQTVEVETPLLAPAAEIDAEPVLANVPEWANNPFQVLLFKVAGLTLAVPLEGLSGVLEWPQSLVEMPGHADFYLGILQHLEQRVAVVDTAKLVYPQNKLKQLADRHGQGDLKRIVLINDGRWGLACDEIAEVVTLTVDQVRWRSQRTQRRWLLGTVIDRMCVLLDTDAFAEHLQTGHD